MVAVFVIPVAYFMHALLEDRGPDDARIQNAMFMKNLALGGAGLALFALFQQFGDEIGLTLTGPLF